MRFEHFVFGSIRIDGRTYEHDVVIDLGAVRKRKKKASRPLRVAYGHTPLSILKGSRGTAIVSWLDGVHGALPIVPELSREAERRGVELVAVPTADAIALLQEDGRDTERRPARDLPEHSAGRDPDVGPPAPPAINGRRVRLRFRGGECHGAVYKSLSDTGKCSLTSDSEFVRPTCLSVKGARSRFCGCARNSARNGLREGLASSDLARVSRAATPAVQRSRCGNGTSLSRTPQSDRSKWSWLGQAAMLYSRMSPPSRSTRVIRLVSFEQRLRGVGSGNLEINPTIGVSLRCSGRRTRPRTRSR